MYLETSVFWIIIIVGILTSFFYLYHDRIKEPEKSEKPPTSWSHFEFFKLEYEQLGQNIRSRDRMAIVAGTILITVSVLLLGNCIQLTSQNIIDFNTKILIISASLAVYIIWLICFNLGSNMLNNISYARLQEMEENASADGKKVDMEHYRYIWKQVENKWWYKPLRRLIWIYFLWVLILLSAFAILL